MAHEGFIWETLKNNFISTNNLQKNNFYDLTFNFWQVQKHIQYSTFCLCERYIFSTDLLIPWHRYGQHIYLCHDTYKCNFWTLTVNNRSNYILVATKLQGCTLCISTVVGANGSKWNNIIKTLKTRLHLTIT